MSEEPGPSEDGKSAAGRPAGAPAADGTGKPVAQGTFDSPNVEGATVDIAVMGLKAQGRLATLTVLLTPRMPADERRGRLVRIHGGPLTTSLIDPVNLKRYVPVADSTGATLQPSGMDTWLAHGNATALVYTFAAPPENVPAVNVQVGVWPTFRNIPVER
ncbi:hypothetical protein [Actinomadura algeriensis]|uniref:Uncharacterized protein n=1 Tax=Actinomadura algeriensis TaxID=1679523 RepID=A0ABR9JUV9_9ACTN|nr:hypothetical protein [Actinomadura algeriensis]MBE1534183.1 hypothetical protein [Actinomadura algeriensis]